MFGSTSAEATECAAVRSPSPASVNSPVAANLPSDTQLCSAARPVEGQPPIVRIPSELAAPELGDRDPGVDTVEQPHPGEIVRQGE